MPYLACHLWCLALLKEARDADMPGQQVLHRLASGASSCDVPALTVVSSRALPEEGCPAFGVAWLAGTRSWGLCHHFAVPSQPSLSQGEQGVAFAGPWLGWPREAASQALHRCDAHCSRHADANCSTVRPLCRCRWQAGALQGCTCAYTAADIQA